MNANLCSPLVFLCAVMSLIAASPQENVKSEAHNPVISHIPHDAVASKGIVSVGYSKRKHILEIEFVNGAVYRYLQVSPAVYRDLMAAECKARYYDANIKGNYPSLRVRSRVTQ